MVITFNELRRIKDKLPSGSSQRIADELGIDVDTVRNYFGGEHYGAPGNAGVCACTQTNESIEIIIQIDMFFICNKL